MEIICIASLKGETGKTQFSFNLATQLAINENKKILCVDLDTQGNLTNLLKNMGNFKYNIYNIFKKI